MTAEEGKSGPQVRVSPTPCCNRDKHTNCVVIATATGFWTCFKCGAKGNWYGFTRAAGEPLADVYEDARPVDLDAYANIRAKLRRPVTQGHHAASLAYCLTERRITGATLDAWKVSTAGPQALRWPLMALDGEGKWQVANARIRRVLGDPDAPRDWFEIKGGPTDLAVGNHLLGKEPLAWKTTRPRWATKWLDPSRIPPAGAKSILDPFPAVSAVLVVEGQWDAMTAWQLGIPNVLSVPNGAGHIDVAALLRYVPEDAQVFIAMDMDAAGDKAAEAFFAQLGSKVTRLRLPAKDLNDWVRQTPELTAEAVLACAEPELEAAAKWVDLASEDEAAPSEIICETPWPLLTRRLGGGWRAGQTTGLLAPSGTGKTTVANNIIAHCVKHRVKCGLVQLEGARGEVVTKLRRQIKNWVRPDMDEELPEYLRYVMLSSLAGKDVTWEQTIDAATEMAKAGAKFIVVDNWDYIMPPDVAGERMKLRAYSALQSVALEYGLHGFVVWQPNKVDRALLVNSGQQKGMSKALQDSDVYMTLNKHGLSRRIEVEKARVDSVGDEVSSIVILRYVVATLCLEESESQADLVPKGAENPPTEEF